MLFTTVINLPSGQATIETLDWNEDGYEVCGFETVTHLPNGDSYGNGPESSEETPLALHLYAVERVVKDHAGPDWTGVTSTWSL